MPKEGTGIEPPLIGKFTGRVRTPLTILAVFFALGVILDLIMEFIARNLIKGLQGRVWVRFRFWALSSKWDYTLPDGTVVDARETIAYDDVILLIITFVIMFFWKVKSWRNRMLAGGGFFLGWWSSSHWLSKEIPWGDIAKASESATEGM